MIGHLISLITHLFNRHKKLMSLCDVYNEYLKNPSDASLQLKLEIAFRHCYRKKASYKLIHRIASAKCGPLEAFESFGKSSSLLVGCDFKNNKPVLGKLQLNPALWSFLAFTFSLLMIAFSLTCMFLGMFLLTHLGVELYFNPDEDFFHNWKYLFPDLFGFSLLCVANFILALVTLYFAIDVMYRSNSVYRAVQVAEELNTENA